ncbi:prephenate dehydratase [Paenibacillus sp. KACC 21273]|uniref:prephenate dehydratase n=1 Tax=Paenibacillus sp. KACC 21273 TaxID=3025665 RepID=UPI0023657822|nr:prephenate dehydratase [Paenibacillus sp. KACC 21273]WDF51964.1 prephenate dehydratase [Paenibacillus sp. KACC 21273]
MIRIAALPSGSVSHEALLHLLGDQEIEIFHHKLIADVFLSTAEGKTDYSVIPIENTIEGSVSLHMDWLVHEVDIPMQAEWVYPSIQNLIGNRAEFSNEKNELDYSGVQKVLSHPVAMAQCLHFIRKEMPHAELEHVGSTAEAVEMVSKNAGKGWTAIGTSLGALRYNLDILADRVTDHDNNYTRFVLIGQQPVHIERAADHTKTSILVTLSEDFAGALHQVLATFSWRKLNLSRIESRPTKKKLGSYYFYLDVLAPQDSILLTAAIEEIIALGCQVRVLGSYPCFEYNLVSK